MYHNAWSGINLNSLISFVTRITNLKNICLNFALCQVRLSVLALWMFLIAPGGILASNFFCDIPCLPIIAKLCFVDYNEVCRHPKNISGICSFISEQKGYSFEVNTGVLACSFCDVLLTCRAHLSQAAVFSNVSGKD